MSKNTTDGPRGVFAMRIASYGWVAVAALSLGSAHAATISLVPVTSTISQGSLLEADLTISGVNNGTTPALGAWDITVSVDPSLLSFSSAKFGTNLDVLGLGDIQNVSSPTSSSTELYEISLDSAADLTAHQATSFTLASLFFNTTGTGTSPLGITINSLADANGGALTASTVPGSVTVAPVPLPGAIWLLGGGLCVFALLSRRRTFPLRLSHAA